MARSLDAQLIADHFLAACQGELEALKPGNVHVFAPGHQMDTAHFEAAAYAAAPHLADGSLGVGTKIERAVRASFDAAGCNTNLGIVLLCAPLAHAASSDQCDADLRNRLAAVLRTLDVEDAAGAFRAIRYAKPGGLGEAREEDVRETPHHTLREAMVMAQDRDRIANAYATDFADIFELGLPTFRTAIAQCKKDGVEETFAVTTLHMTYLASFADSHIARKFGEDVALAVQRDAKSLFGPHTPFVGPEHFQGLLEFDRSLKLRGLNPGTTADLVVATLFADLLEVSLA